MQVEKNIGNEKSAEGDSKGEAERERERKKIQCGSHKVSHLCSLPSRQVSYDLQHHCPSHLT